MGDLMLISIDIYYVLDVMLACTRLLAFSMERVELDIFYFFFVLTMQLHSKIFIMHTGRLRLVLGKA